MQRVLFLLIAQYTEADIQNKLADIKNRVPTATAATRHGIPRTTLRGRNSDSQHHGFAHKNIQQLSPEQEDHLAH